MSVTPAIPMQRIPRLYLRLFAVAALALVTETAVWGQHRLSRGGKLSPDLLDTRDEDLVDVIVQYTHAPDEAGRMAVRARGGLVKHTFESIGAEHYRVSGAHLRDLAGRSDVSYITPDRPVRAFLDQALNTIGGPTAALSGYTGRGIGIAVIDSGIGVNSDVFWSVVYRQSWTGDTDDHFGHGTHVAGILAGSGVNSTGLLYTRTFKGLATGASLISLKVLDGNGSGNDSSVISAIQTAISLKSRYNIRVINLSLGRPVFESYKLDPVDQAVEAAWKAGIVVVAAAGNFGRTAPGLTNGYGTITVPGNDPYVITVGAMNDMGTATRSDDVIASYSSKGPTLYDAIVKPDLVAPGNMIDSSLAPLSPLPSSYPQTQILISSYQFLGLPIASPTYMQLSGTSMAAPWVSGAAALLLQQNGSLSPDQVKARLMKTAYKTFPTTSSYTDPSTKITYKEQ